MGPHVGHGQLGHSSLENQKRRNALFILNAEVPFQLLLLITVVDVCRDGGIIKKVLKKGMRNAQPGDLDEVMAHVLASLDDGKSDTFAGISKETKNEEERKPDGPCVKRDPCNSELACIIYGVYYWDT
ncbi:hypothetical protein Sjap_010008 [Stephania japonica]|uniref:Uncharacterized protein n=1 Tax=Stephania japonica TaxID=461633 RepID=A0AAP0P6R1_9MAGN